MVESRFAIDSTGFRTTKFGTYCNEKHRTGRVHQWLKAHLSTGVRTNVVADVIVTDSMGEGTGDSSNFRPLVAGTLEAGFRPSSIAADKAYSGHANHEAAVAIGADPLIPFRRGATGRAHGSGAWRKAFLYFQLHREEFEKRYHERSNVESTIGAIKKKFGDGLKSKNRVAQENELLCKVVAYNITVLIHEMFENGIEPEFIGLKPRDSARVIGGLHANSGMGER